MVNRNRVVRIALSLTALLACISGLIYLNKWVNQPSHVFVKWVNMYNIEHALLRFNKNYGRPPTEEEGLSILVLKPKDWSNKRPWSAMLKSPELLVDGWGNQFQYRVNPPGKSYGVYSLGDAGVAKSLGEDEDDINSWTPPGSGNRRYIQPSNAL